MNEISRNSEDVLVEDKNQLAGNEISRNFTPISQNLDNNL